MQEYLLRWQTFINTQKTHGKKEPKPFVLVRYDIGSDGCSS